jgi:release factor glutamine methyltransferase
VEEARAIAYRLLEHFLGYSLAELHEHYHEEVPEKVREDIIKLLPDLKNNKPLQYVLGQTEFYDYIFQLSPGVLIPRPETEELVHWIIRENPGFRGSILDIGTGSGCIAVALAGKLPGSQVSAIDYSEEILEVARENAQRNKIAIHLFQKDILSGKPEDFPGHFDIIVSNPPYVTELEKKLMHANVLEHEPAEALFVKGNDPLVFYQRIATLAKYWLKPAGKLYFEMNESFGKPMQDLLKSLGFQDVVIKKDLFGKNRMIRGIAYDQP